MASATVRVSVFLICLLIGQIVISHQASLESLAKKTVRSTQWPVVVKNNFGSIGNGNVMVVKNNFQSENEKDTDIDMIDSNFGSIGNNNFIVRKNTFSEHWNKNWK